MHFKDPTQLKPWEKQPGEEILAKGFGKHLKKVLFRNPTTGEVQDFIMFGQRDWSVVLPVTADGFVVAERQYKQGCDKIYIDLPAGTTDFKGELPQVVAERELLQETGYKAEDVIFLGPPQWMSSRNSQTRFWPFVALGCEKVQPAKIDDNEEIETLLIPVAEWVEFCVRGLAQGDGSEDPSANVVTFRALPHIHRYLPDIDLAKALGIA